MGSTYRRVLIYTSDNTFYEPIEAKRMTRKVRRRRERAERHKITREATMGFYSEQEEAAWEARLSDGEFMYDEFNNYLGAIGDEKWEPEPYEAYDDTDYGDDWGSYYDPWDYTRSEQPEDRIIKPEDTGKTLGELLQEIADRGRSLQA